MYCLHEVRYCSSLVIISLILMPHRFDQVVLLLEEIGCGLNRKIKQRHFWATPTRMWLDTAKFVLLKGDVTRDDSRRQFLAQHSIAMLEQCCNCSKQCRNNITTLCCTKSHRCKSSCVTSPLRDNLLKHLAKNQYPGMQTLNSNNFIAHETVYKE